MWHVAGFEPASRRVSGWRASSAIADLDGKIKNMEREVGERNWIHPKLMDHHETEGGRKENSITS